MTNQITAVVPPSLEEDYKVLLMDLQLLERDLLERGCSKDAVFINNMILRLKVWAADIDVAGGALKSAEKIGPLATQIRLRLAELKAQCESFRHAPSKAGAELADYKHNFTQPIDSLSTFSEPLKTARTDLTKETGLILKINARLIESSFYQNTRGGLALATRASCKSTRHVPSWLCRSRRGTAHTPFTHPAITLCLRAQSPII